MNILVCISKVPDTITKVTFTYNNTQFNTKGVLFILNLYEEIALADTLGISVSPNLYIAVPVSGAKQHLAGNCHYERI